MILKTPSRPFAVDFNKYVPNFAGADNTLTLKFNNYFIMEAILFPWKNIKHMILERQREELM